MYVYMLTVYMHMCMFMHVNVHAHVCAWFDGRASNAKICQLLVVFSLNKFKRITWYLMMKQITMYHNSQHK